MPAMYLSRVFADLGDLFSYGGGLPELYHRVGIYVGKVLKGANPTGLPIQQSAKLNW